MSQPMNQTRLRQLTVVGGIAIAVTLIALVMAVLEARQTWRPDVEGLVLADWAEQVDAVRAIEIQSPDDHFTVAREGDDWVMPSRDGHVVNPERIAQIDALLGSLSHVGTRTADPAKHARLGLAAPGAEGAGILFRVLGTEDEILAELIVGEERDGRIYVRFLQDDQTFASQTDREVGVIRELGQADRWLELDFIELGRSGIARTRIEPERGPAYLLERASPSSRNFSLREPAGWQPITAGAGNGPGASLARLRFRDVRLADRLRGERVASHTAETFEGLRVRLDVIAMGETRWAIIEAEALSDDAGAAADAMNARAAGWAYLLSDLSRARLLRPLDGIADPRTD
jgi:hypothetical protein